MEDGSFAIFNSPFDIVGFQGYTTIEGNQELLKVGDPLKLVGRFLRCKPQNNIVPFLKNLKAQFCQVTS